MDVQAYWLKVLWDDFSSGSSAWTYAGVSNAYNRPLIACNSVNRNVRAEWDQSNVFVGTGDPYTIIPSRLSRTLGCVLTDDDTIRFGATLNIATGSVPNTSEYYETANIGLYNLAEMGPDRAMSDNLSRNSNLLKDGSDFIEFNYFIGNNTAWDYFPSAEVTMGAHITGLDGDYYFNWKNPRSMGVNHWLPEGTNLYVEVVYYGSATNDSARRSYGAIYTDPTRANLLVVNGVELYYWTPPLPTNKSFTLTDIAFFNYAAANWGGANGAGAGTFDDVYVEKYLKNGDILSYSLQGEQLVTTWVAASGATYYVNFSTNLCANAWVTNAVLEASGETMTYTNFISGMRGYYRVSH